MTQRNLKLFPILLWHVLSEGDGTVGAAIQRVIHTRDLTGCYLGHRLLQVVRDSGDLAPPASDTPGVQVEWKRAAAVYTNFSSYVSLLGVKPIDGDKLNPYKKSDHAGVPENYKSYVVGGARGGGGSNWTGSYSGTASVSKVCPPPQQP